MYWSSHFSSVVAMCSSMGCRAHDFEYRTSSVDGYETSLVIVFRCYVTMCSWSVGWPSNGSQCGVQNTTRLWMRGHQICNVWLLCVYRSCRTPDLEQCKTITDTKMVSSLFSILCYDVPMKRLLAKYIARSLALRFWKCKYTQCKSTTMQVRPIIFLTPCHCISVSSYSQTTRLNTYMLNSLLCFTVNTWQHHIAFRYCHIYKTRVWKHKCWNDYCVLQWISNTSVDILYLCVFKKLACEN